MVMGLSVDEYKGQTGAMLLAVSTQSSKKSISEVLCYVLDPKLDFEVLQTFRIEWDRPLVTSIFYNPGCGLIVSAFNGLIQIFDPVVLNKAIWDNKKAHKPPKSRGKGAKYIHGAINCFSYSE